MEYVQISTRSELTPDGINYYTIYKETYLKENDWKYIKEFILKNIVESKEEGELLLKQYVQRKKKQIIQNDLKVKLEEKWKNNPAILHLKLEELNSLFNNSLIGSGRDKTDPTRVLKSDGVLKGSMIIGLALILGIAIALLMLAKK